MAIVNDKFRVKNGLRVDNELKENIFEVNDTVIESQRTFEANAASALDVPIIVNSNLSQSADLQQWKNPSSEVIVKVDKDGKIFSDSLETVNDVIVGGNLTVNGTTTTIHSTIATVEDPVILLGGELPPESADGKWRGVEFRWYDTEANTGFFGFDNSTSRFTFIPDAVNDGEIFTGNIGDLQFNNGFFDGEVEISGGRVTSTNTTFNLLTDNVEIISIGFDATQIYLGSTEGKTKIFHDLEVSGNFDLLGTYLNSSSETFDLLSSPTTINLGSSSTDIQIGSSTGTTNINNDLDVDGNINVDGENFTVSTSIFNLANTTTTTVNFAGAATDVQIGSSTGTTNVNNNLDVDGDLNIDGGDLTASTSVFNLLDTPTTINVGAAATDIQIGSSSGTTNINNNLDVDGDLNVDGGDITVGTATFNLANTTAETVNFAGAATNIQIGSSSGTTNINNDLDVDGDINIDGGDLTVSTSNFNLANTNATTVNFAGEATDIQIGASTGTTNVNNNLDIDGDLNVDGGDITSNLASFDLLNTNVENIDFAGAATNIIVGATSGTTNVRNNLDVDLDLTVKGGDIKVTTALVNVVNDTAETVNFAGAATSLNVGSATGTTTVNNSLIVKKVLTVEGTTTNFNPPVSSAPFTIGTNAFDVLVAGLNADKLDGQTGSWYQDRANHTGTQLSTTISDWSEAVQDIVAPMFVHSQQTGISAQYNDDTGRILLTVTGGGSSGGGDFSLSYWMGV